MRWTAIGLLVAALAFGPSAASTVGGENVGHGFDASVVVYADRPDRVAILIDGDRDGKPDRVVWATARHAASVGRDVTGSLPLTLPDAHVTVNGSDDVRVEGNDERGEPWAVRVRMEHGRAERFGLDGNGRARVLRLENGAAVTQLDLPAGAVPVEGMEATVAGELTSDFVTVARRVGSDRPGAQGASPHQGIEDEEDDGCDSGGKGAASCSQNCGYTAGVSASFGIGAGANGGISLGCSVTCGAGYHACCNCGVVVRRLYGVVVPQMGAVCLCVENETD
jgi:hypothetical protein